MGHRIYECSSVRNITYRQIDQRDYKDAGFEPAANPEVTDCGCCIYLDCQDACAANALHPEFLKCLELALYDADLQLVIAGWKLLSDPVRKAVVTLIG